MSQFDLLQPQRQALREQHSLLSQKVSELLQNAAYAAEAAVRLQIEKQMNISLGTQGTLSTIVEWIRQLLNAEGISSERM